MVFDLFYFYFSKYKQNTLFNITICRFALWDKIDWCLFEIDIDVDYHNGLKFIDHKRIKVLGIPLYNKNLYNKNFENWDE